MILISMVLFFALILSLVLYFFTFTSSYKLKIYNKMTSFECGFVSVGSLISSFSIHFFMIVVIFVVFELEVVLLIGCLLSTGNFTFFFLMLFIIGGMYLEFSLGKLSWMV